MALFEEGEEIEVDRSAVRRRTGRPLGGPGSPPTWDPAVVLSVQTSSDGFEFYHIRVTGGPLRGAVGPLPLDVLRRPA